MKQYSTDSNTPLQIEILSGHLLFIDPLYFQDIADGYSAINTTSISHKKEIVKLYEEQLFPDGGGGLLGYRYVGESIGTYLFDPKILETWESEDDDDDDEAIEEQAALKHITAFRLDSSTFLIIDLANMDKLVGIINYDDLIDAMLDKKLDKYFDKTNQQLGNQGWGFCEVHGDSSFIIP